MLRTHLILRLDLDCIVLPRQCCGERDPTQSYSLKRGSKFSGID
jgi:hypothetical protein